jgi:hypothetical protein
MATKISDTVDVTKIPAGIDLAGYHYVTTWDGLIQGSRISTGHAAHRNRGRFTGQKVHRVVCTDVIGIADPAREIRPGTFAAKFVATGKPVTMSARPACGCTQGQFAASESAGLEVTCSKCLPAAASTTAAA